MIKKLLFILAVFAVNTTFAQDGKVFQGTKGEINDILDLGSPITNFTCTVSGVGTITPNLLNNMTFNIKHTFTGDLTITLISPANTVVSVAAADGGLEDFINTIITQNAADPFLFEGDNPFTGTFQPNGDSGGLESFDGESADGVWTLQVNDAVAGDSGEMLGWSLQFGGETPNPFFTTPIANFGFDVDSADSKTVLFSDSSLNEPSTWLWSFGDDSTDFQPSPTHTYAEDGIYEVSLVVTNEAGTDTIIKTITVGEVVELAPVADFKVKYDSLILSFTDLSQNNPLTWAWNFGDDSTSTDQNPMHTYKQTGIYTVCLISGNAFGSDTLCKEIDIDKPTGLNNIIFGSELKMYPNPTKDILNISALRNLDAVKIVNLLGAVVLENTINGNSKALDVSRLPEGMYSVMIYANGLISSQKLIIIK